MSEDKILIAQNWHKDKEPETYVYLSDYVRLQKKLEAELKTEQDRTLRYKELLYSQTEQGREIEKLEAQLREANKKINNMKKEIFAMRMCILEETQSDYCDDNYDRFIEKFPLAHKLAAGEEG